MTTTNTPNPLTYNGWVQAIASLAVVGTQTVSGVVETVTAFTYATATAISAASLLTDTSRITALVGLPLGETQIPQVAS